MGKGGCHELSSQLRADWSGRRWRMLHVRVVSPPALTGRLADLLIATAGVQNLVVQPGAATRPDGDSVQFDMRDEAANPVFRDLRGLGLDRAGAICVEQVDATLADHALIADHGAIVRERAPVWEMVEATIRAGAAYSPSFYILLVAAGLIGAVGILTNSQILIVGAMVVGPEYSAIIAVALGISKGARGPVRDGLLALLWGFLAAIVITLLFGLAVRAAGQAPASFLKGTRPVSNLIDTPNMYSVIVAILAGLVGVGPGLGHHHPRRRRRGRVARVLELAGSTGIGAPIAPQHRRAYRGRRGGPQHAAHDLATADDTITGPVNGPDFISRTGGLDCPSQAPLAPSR